MKYLVVAIALALVPAASGQKLTKEEKPIEVTIQVTQEEIKAELLRVHLADGFKLCKETPSQLIFCKSDKPHFAYIDSREFTFTLIADGGQTAVSAESEINRTNALGGARRFPDPDKSRKRRLQDLLNRVKHDLEH